MEVKHTNFQTKFYDGNHIIRFGVDTDSGDIIQHFMKMTNGEIWIEKYVLNDELKLVEHKKVFDFNEEVF